MFRNSESKRSTRLAIIIYIGFMFIISGCNQKYDIHDLYSHVNSKENGLVQELNVGHTLVTLSYQPVQILVWNELKNMKSCNEAIIDSLEFKYSNYDTFILEIGNRKNKDYAKTKEWMRLLRTQTDKILEISDDNGEEIKILNLHEVRTYGMSNHYQVLICTEKIKEHLKYIQFRFSTSSQLGTKAIKIKTKHILSLPKINYPEIPTNDLNNTYEKSI